METRKNKKFIYFSGIISLVLHFLLYGFAGSIIEKNLYSNSLEDENNIINIESYIVDDTQNDYSTKNDSKISTQAIERINTILKNAGLSIKQMIPKAIIKAPDEYDKLPEDTIKNLPLVNVAIPPNILTIKEDTPNIDEKTKEPGKDLPFNIPSSMNSIYANRQRVKPALALQLKRTGLDLDLQDFDNSDDENKSRLKTLSNTGAGTILDIQPKIKKPRNMDAFLKVTPSIYIDNELGQGFFQLLIKIDESKKDLMPNIPKDILFLIDSSTSISVLKLREFKRGITNALKSLGTKDKFNVVAFRERPVNCFKNFMNINQKNLDSAKKFLRFLRSKGRTDVYSGLSPFLTRENSASGERPKIIFIMTDGQSTVKKSMSNTKLIHNISERNNNNIAIYAYGIGKKVNTFLLDFLTYNNRGSSETVQNIKHSNRLLTKMINSISQVVVSDLEFQVSGAIAEEVYPLKLPHLYKGHTLAVYGTFDLRAKSANIRITGKSVKGLEEFVYKIDFKNSPQGTKEIARSWASQKIFHLIAEAISGKKQNIYRKEIRRLQKVYGISIPYNLNFKN